MLSVGKFHNNIQFKTYLRLVTEIFKTHILLICHLLNHIRYAHPTCYTVEKSSTLVWKIKRIRGWNILISSHDLWFYFLNHAKLESHIPKLIALTKMVRASMKMIIDALPRSAIIFLTTCWPVKAANVATKTK